MENKNTATSVMMNQAGKRSIYEWQSKSDAAEEGRGSWTTKSHFADDTEFFASMKGRGIDVAWYRINGGPKIVVS